MHYCDGFVQSNWVTGVFLIPNKQRCGSGSGIRCLFDPWIRDLGSGIGFFRIPDLGSRIPNPYFWELRDNFLGKKFYNSLKIGPNFFLQHFKNKIVQFCEIYDSKKRYDNKFFSPMSFITVFGSGIRDPRSGIRDPGSGINIPDPPHCQQVNLITINVPVVYVYVNNGLNSTVSTVVGCDLVSWPSGRGQMLCNYAPPPPHPYSPLFRTI